MAQGFLDAVKMMREEQLREQVQPQGPLLLC